MLGILGKKVGMTRIHDESGKSMPITVVEAVPSEVLGLCTKEKNGYDAVQIGIENYKKPSKNSPKKRFIREMRLKEPSSYKVGDMIACDIFKEGDYVDVTGLSKGKGFAGGMKRWNWRGGPSGHGSMHHRAPGSIGSNTYPGRVWKGHHMPGHLGNEKVTVQNLQVIKVDKELNMIALNGPVPGSNNSYLVIHVSKKKTKKVVTKDGSKK